MRSNVEERRRGEIRVGAEVVLAGGASWALPSAIQGISPSDVGMEKGDFLAAIPAVGVMLVWIGALFGLGAALLVKRDVE